MLKFSTGARISALFASSFIALGVQLPFFPVLLAHRGLSDGEIALVVAAPMILRLTTVSALGAFADRVGNRRLVLVAYAGLTLLGGLTLGPAHGFWAILAATAAMSLFWNGMMPVTDALATSAARSGGAVYGRMRSWGSISFVVTNLVAGRLVGEGGGSVVYPMLLCGFVLQFAVAIFAPIDVGKVEAGNRPSMWAGLLTLAADRRLMGVLIGAALVQSSHAMLYGFSTLYWTSIGFSGGEIGSLWAVGVVGEVVLFAMAAQVLPLMGARGLLLLGGVGAVMRWCLFPLAGAGATVWVLLQLTHAASFASVHLGTMHIVTRSVGDSRAASAQGLMVSFTGLGMALSTLFSGVLYAHFGGAGFYGMAVVAALGTAVLVGVLGLRRDG